MGSATIHWQRVPLSDAIQRLKPLFGEAVFVDRRIDPSIRVSLDIEASSLEEVVAAIAADHGLGAARLGKLVYLGPASAAAQLRAIAAARSRDVGRLPADLRSTLANKQRLAWPHLSEPRGLISQAIDKRGWRLTNAEQVPHDLWAANELPEMTIAEQLTVLLIGFDLTFTMQANDRTIELVPLKSDRTIAGAEKVANRPAARADATRPKPEGKQVYTLRVKEQPVRAILQELSKRLHWSIEIDEQSIRAAGKLDQRVSFSVENADQERLLDALLRPAGLDYQLQDGRVRIIGGREGDDKRGPNRP